NPLLFLDDNAIIKIINRYYSARWNVNNGGFGVTGQPLTELLRFGNVERQRV
ncbi:MAG: hypothetical protein HFJ09_03800, partial [Lachnospiraceae bacterium]|nr:hypothetical protein [Lachnospiraceae bacterium]